MLLARDKGKKYEYYDICHWDFSDFLVYAAYTDWLKHKEKKAGVREQKNHGEDFVIFHFLDSEKEISLRPGTIQGFSKVEDGEGTILYLMGQNVIVSESDEKIAEELKKVEDEGFHLSFELKNPMKQKNKKQ